MPFLEKEQARARAAKQAAESRLASLGVEIDTQQTARAAAAADAEAGRVRLAEKETQRPNLEAEAAAKDDAVAAIGQQIEELQQAEPEQTI